MTQPLVGKQILIVEDEPVFRSLMDSWFSSLGATTAVAGDGLEALELLGHFTPDLMICDLAMPRIWEQVMHYMLPKEMMQNFMEQEQTLTN